MAIQPSASGSKSLSLVALPGALAALLLCLVCAPAAAADHLLPEGIQGEPGLFLTVLRVLAALWGLFLLLSGRRFGRSSAGTFFMVVGLAAGLLLFSKVHLPLALALALCFFALGMAAQIFAPRLSMAFALLWPLAAAYLVAFFSTGAFKPSPVISILLVVAGLLIGAILPKAGLSLLSSSLGALLLFVALPWKIDARWALAVAAFGLVVQWTALPWILRKLGGREGSNSPYEPTRRELWVQSVLRGGAVLLLLFAATALFTPMLSEAAGPGAARMAALARTGSLSRPGLVVSAENAYYLSGRPVSLALVSRDGSFLDRLSFLALGRDLTQTVRGMRAVKDGEELARIRRASAITSKAFEEVRPSIKPGVNEGEIERLIEESFRRNGATGLAFRGIVASGPNALLPHYDRNDAEMKDGFVVIDIGCSVDRYCSDMTRTFPVSGTWTEAQRKLGQLVLEAHDAAAAELKPGASLGDANDAAKAVFEKAGLEAYYLHFIGHHVGLNVHDPGGMQRLKPGMVVTVEPGLYIPRGAKADASYQGLGIRIEDLYLVTETGCEALTSYPPLG